MADKKTPEVKTPPLSYSDDEVNDIMITQQKIYAIDDAIFNQIQLQRPPGYIEPLRKVRKDYADRLMALTSKGEEPPLDPSAGPNSA